MNRFELNAVSASVGFSALHNISLTTQALLFVVRFGSLAESIQLATGHDLTKLSGIVRIKRLDPGSIKETNTMLGFIQCNEVDSTNDFYGDDPDPFIVEISIPIATFDRIGDLVNSNRLPKLRITLDWEDDGSTGIDWDPDVPHSTTWNNKDHPWIKIIGYDFDFTLVERTDYSSRTT